MLHDRIPNKPADYQADKSNLNAEAHFKCYRERNHIVLNKLHRGLKREKSLYSRVHRTFVHGKNIRLELMAKVIVKEL